MVDTTQLFNEEGDNVGVDAYFMESYEMRSDSRVIPANYNLNIHAVEEYGRWSQSIHLDFNKCGEKTLDTMIAMLIEAQKRIQNHPSRLHSCQG